MDSFLHKTLGLLLVIIVVVCARVAFHSSEAKPEEPISNEKARVITRFEAVTAYPLCTHMHEEGRCFVWTLVQDHHTGGEYAVITREGSPTALTVIELNQ
jgi:hypothetical protein